MLWDILRLPSSRRAALGLHVFLKLWRGRGANQPPYALLHRSSPRYTLRHGRRRKHADCTFSGGFRLNLLMMHWLRSLRLVYKDRVKVIWDVLLYISLSELLQCLQITHTVNKRHLCSLLSCSKITSFTWYVVHNTHNYHSAEQFTFHSTQYTQRLSWIKHSIKHTTQYTLTFSWKIYKIHYTVHTSAQLNKTFHSTQYTQKTQLNNTFHKTHCTIYEYTLTLSY